MAVSISGRKIMKGYRIGLVIGFLLLAGCSMISGMRRVEDFSNISKTYEHTMLNSDFRAGVRFIDPSVLTAEKKAFYKTYENVKVFDYEVTDVTVSDDRLTITQHADIEYYLLDCYIMRRLQDRQIWKYNRKTGNWRLWSGLPEFDFSRR